MNETKKYIIDMVVDNTEPFKRSKIIFDNDRMPILETLRKSEYIINFTNLKLSLEKK